MLSAYLQAAMKRAHYELLSAEEGFYGEIPGFQGVWANAPTLEECRNELAEVLEEWIFLGISRGEVLPTIDGMRLAVRQVAV